MESSTTRLSSLARLGVVLGVFGVVAGVASVLIQDVVFRSAGSPVVYTSEEPFDSFAFSLPVSAVLILAALVAVAVAAVIASVLLVRWARRSREAARHRRVRPPGVDGRRSTESTTRRDTTRPPAGPVVGGAVRRLPAPAPPCLPGSGP